MALERASNRKQEILENLAQMLENPKREKITTAALAAKLGVSEAALYRHFANKAKMFEGLIEFIEQSVFGVINKIMTDETDGAKQVQLIVNMMLRFAEKNPGMTRVLIGDALVNEDEYLQVRINQLIDRIEASIKQSLRIAQSANPEKPDASAAANLMMGFIIGRWQLFVKSQFKRMPLEFANEQLALLLLMVKY
jgi:TetR/AcrR family transcriptional regulator